MKALFFFFLLVAQFNGLGQLGSRFNIGTAPIQANPAYIGILSHGAINSNLTIAEFDYFMINASYQTHLKKSNSGIGIVTGVKRFEFYSIASHGASYSYQTKLSDKLTLSTGLSAFYTADRDDFFPEFDTSFFSFDAGAVLYSKQFFLSFSSFDFRRQSEILNYSSSFGYVIHSKKLMGLSITPVLGLALNNGTGYFNARINSDYKDFKFVIGGASNEFLTGLGYENHKVGLHYFFSIIKPEFSNSFNFDNRFSLTIKMPRFIKRNTDSFDFKLF